MPHTNSCRSPPSAQRYAAEKGLELESLALDNIVTGLDDSIRLIYLVEALTGKPLGRFSKNPRSLIQRTENLNLPLGCVAAERGMAAASLVPTGGGGGGGKARARRRACWRTAWLGAHDASRHPL